MVQPAVLTESTRAIQNAARALDTPRDVQHFLAQRGSNPAVAAYLETPEWAAIYERIVGDGTPVRRARHEQDVARFLRARADDMEGITARDALLLAVAELEALASRRAAAPVSPAGPRASTWGRASFSEALKSVKSGWRIMRAGWPDGMFVVAQAGYPDGIGINANTAAASGLPEGTEVVFPPYLMQVQLPLELTGTRAWMTRWAPSDEDMFAEDWQVLPQRGAVVRSGSAE